MINPTLATALAEVVDLIPRKVRTVIYAAAVVVALLAIAAQGVTDIWFPELDDRVDATTARVVAACLFIVGALGFAYRPTRASLEQLQPAEPADEAVYTQEALARTIATLTGAGYSLDAAVDAVMAGNLSVLNRPAEPASPEDVRASE
ncbi:hypothetical protein [Promicromonospora sp. NFX87]|uniref:hypothetical protein n=1 Tax=Promicromonospora sp. NFX87 TaxID=3402691 RepID=UPI003AFA1D24